MKKLFLTLFLCFSLINPVWAGVDFDGTDDRITATLTGGSVFTCSVWVNVTTLVSDKYIIQRMNASNNANYGLAIILKNSLYYFRMNGWTGSGQPDLDTLTAISANVWYHVTGVWNGTSSEIYLNGVIDNSGSQGTHTSGNEFYVAANKTSSFIDATIEEVAVWNTNLSAGQIVHLGSSRIKRMPLQIAPSNLKLYWPMDDEPDGTSFDGDTARDLSGNGNNGTGDNGANNTGLTAKAGEVLSYP